MIIEHPGEIEPDGTGDWRLHARCKGVEPSVFFPSNGGLPPSLAYLFCAECPVRPECLEYALANHMVDGVFGGTTPKQRLSIQRERRRRQAVS